MKAILYKIGNLDTTTIESLLQHEGFCYDVVEPHVKDFMVMTKGKM